MNVDDEYYIVVSTSSNALIIGENTQIFKIDMKNKTYKLISPAVFPFNGGGTVVCGNRIYLFNDDDKLNVKMVYFDTETNQFSQVHTICYPDVVRK